MLILRNFRQAPRYTLLVQKVHCLGIWHGIFRVRISMLLPPAVSACSLVNDDAAPSYAITRDLIYALRCFLLAVVTGAAMLLWSQ